MAAARRAAASVHIEAVAQCLPHAARIDAAPATVGIQVALYWQAFAAEEVAPGMHVEPHMVVGAAPIAAVLHIALYTFAAAAVDFAAVQCTALYTVEAVV